MPNFIKPTFPKKGRGQIFKKKKCWNQQGVIEWYASFVLSPPTPFQQTVGGSDSGLETHLNLGSPASRFGAVHFGFLVYAHNEVRMFLSYAAHRHPP